MRTRKTGIAFVLLALALAAGASGAVLAMTRGSDRFRPPRVDVEGDNGVRAGVVPSFCPRGATCPRIGPPRIKRLIPVHPDGRILVEVHAKAKRVSLLDPDRGTYSRPRKLDDDGRTWSFRVPKSERRHRVLLMVEIDYPAGSGSLLFVVGLP